MENGLVLYLEGMLVSKVVAMKLRSLTMKRCCSVKLGTCVNVYFVEEN
jgi:hypothetical protein